jgi:hypothetical protein
MITQRITLLSILAIVAIGLPWAAAQQSPVVLLDGYHNNQPKPHYRWEGTYAGGYSEFGKLLKSMGAEIRTVSEPLTAGSLHGGTCLVIVNPATPALSEHPHYIESDEIVAVREWVRAGGLLVLLGNDPGHMEFEHFNDLAREFGLKFLEVKHQNANGISKLDISIAPGGPYFGAGGVAHFVDVAPIGVTAPFAQNLLSDNHDTLMTLTSFGQGRVLALGDPWVYNEYIDTRDNRALVEALFRFLFGAPHAAPQYESKPIPFDGSGVRPGPIHLEANNDSVGVSWSDERSQTWTATFSLLRGQPLITSIAATHKPVLEHATPIYRCHTGKRRGGWDEFFDFPPSHPEGTRDFLGVFQPVSASAQTVGNRLQVQFDGLKLGILEGSIRYTFYPGTRLLRQEAVVVTHEPDTAILYETGLRIGNASGEVTYYDTKGQLQTALSSGPQSNPVKVHYRALAGALKGGSIVVFPAPHQYFFPRDNTTNLATVWHAMFHDSFSMGIRQPTDDNTNFYPWFSAPAGSEQHLGVFLLLSDAPPAEALADVLKFTNGDRFPEVEGYKTVTLHWHFGYTVEAMKNGFDWVPPFKPVLKAMGVQAAVLADFHGDGHPRDVSGIRLQELENFFRGCRAQSDQDFLMLPGEEADVHLGGHWIGIFPKPVYWFMGRPEGTPFRATDPRYGTVYRVVDEHDMFNLIKRENAFVYTTHPRTKASKDFPDNYRDKDFYLDSHFFGGSWKDINIDLSSPRLGDRSLNLLNDMNNWGQPKKILAEVDVFKISSEDELYGHMNVNYVRMDRLPDFDHYGAILPPLERGDFFVSSGEIVLPEATLHPAANGGIEVHAHVRWTFPLRFAEVVWGDGKTTFNQTFSLEYTGPFGDSTFDWKVQAGEWKWARFAIWDIASDGAFINPLVR